MIATEQAVTELYIDLRGAEKEHYILYSSVTFVPNSNKTSGSSGPRARGTEIYFVPKYFFKELTK